MAKNKWVRMVEIDGKIVSRHYAGPKSSRLDCKNHVVRILPYDEKRYREDNHD